MAIFYNHPNYGMWVKGEGIDGEYFVLWMAGDDTTSNIIKDVFVMKNGEVEEYDYYNTVLKDSTYLGEIDFKEIEKKLKHQ